MKPLPIISPDHIRTAVGLGISLMLHVLLVLLLRTPMQKPPEPAGTASRAPLVVELNRQPLERKSAPPLPTASRAPTPQPPRPPAPVRPRQEKPVAKKPVAPRPPAPPRPAEPARVAPVQPSLAAPRNETPPSDMSDMSDMVAAARARRRAAGVPVPDDSPRMEGARPQGDEVARANVARSIAQARGRNGAGGVFQITNKGAREASFLFRGWDNDSRAALRELVQVDAGPGGNVEDAIVRKMIELIRKYQPGDFSWNSHRLGRVVTLSARREDTAGLEEFLKKEFF